MPKEVYLFNLNQRRKNLIQQKETDRRNMYRKSAVTQVLSFTLLNVKEGRNYVGCYL